MPRHEATELDDFALPGLPLAKMTGVSAAVHAIPDAFLLLHGGVGCKYKAAAQLAKHDWASHPNEREGWTQVGEMALIQGAATRIGPFARSWYERRRPGLMVVASSTSLALTGEDIAKEVREAEHTLPCDLALVPTTTPNGGFFEGYAQVIRELCRKLPWQASQKLATRGAAVVGFFFHRYEAEQLYDLTVLNKLLKVAGLESGPVLLSGRPVAELRRATGARFIIELPYARPVRQGLAELYGERRVIPTDLPMGLSGTARWLREVTRATGGNAQLSEAWIDRQMELARGRLARAVRRLQDLRVAIFADTPLAAGLTSLLRELGVTVVAVGLRDTSLGGEEQLRRSLDRDGVTLDGQCVVLERPSLRTTQQLFADLTAEGALSTVIGSSIELDALAHLPPKLRPAPLPSDGTLIRGHSLIEAGFPTFHHHQVYPLPTLGFSGAVAWAQRLLDATLARALPPREES